ncbi:c-type cytochrome [Pelagibacterium xiamenense]|uniref:c-type cytochrome n=1 Tax=Pelagibacterium xiamenense TaxID=2901140 RepID=UPI001E4FFE5E|nr:cytochrome c family protein [Pelagibacterium xiamenense]MCD7058404.1 cytochrome c family protein [Pelagibacterium xiamenense]
MHIDWKARVGAIGLGVMMLAPGAAAGQEVSGDPAAGEQVFTRCMACHRVGPGAVNTVGPALNGVVNQPAGSVEGFNYSDAMKNSGVTWDVEALMAFLEAPQQFLPGTRMAFPGLPEEADRANVIAYLAQFDEEGNPAAQ